MTVDTTRGIWLESRRLDDGIFDYWMMINGKRIDLSRDDFLAMHTAEKETREKERERIIKLLKGLDCEANGLEHDCNPLDGYTISDLIQLIKGEKK